jgi:hypothetical protein
MNQSTHAIAMNAAAPIAASVLMVISGESTLALVAEDHPVLVSCRIIGADQRIRVSCEAKYEFTFPVMPALRIVQAGIGQLEFSILR